MSTLLHPIHGTREKFRPKHQVLILRCYPKFQKGVQEVKPNSSELSYLLYYASTKRSKLQKIGAFLEKKTASDVWRQKLGNVQVTLQILTSIIEKSPRDVSLYANSLLIILNTVLGSRDVNMIEESIHTFESYCKYVDAAALGADRERTKQYLNIVKQYADYASTSPSTNRVDLLNSVPVSIRWRTLSLTAVRAVVGSDAFLVSTQQQLDIVMPVILDNLHLEKGGSLEQLQNKASSGEKQSMEVARKRKLSSAAAQPLTEKLQADPVMAADTTAAADLAAEEEVRVLAIRCLQQIFSISTGSSRNQLRLATIMLLRYVIARERPRLATRSGSTMSLAPDWAMLLFETVTRWAPVQDRFLILNVITEVLARSPIREDHMVEQLTYASLIEWVLKSDINLIGLSVMDILLRIIGHTLLLLQLGSRDAEFVSTRPVPGTIDLHKEISSILEPSPVAPESTQGRPLDTKEDTPSPLRKDLLAILEKCISGLATHIYYTDQISDMITAIMARLKPSSFSSQINLTAVQSIDDPVAAEKKIMEAANLQEDPTTDGFFSFATARVLALQTVKDILVTANNRRTSGGSTAEVRSRVGVNVWDGTQWLLKDEDSTVRASYVDAIVTWLRLETNKSDLLLPRDGVRNARALKRESALNGENSLPKRLVSNATRKEARSSRSTFLPLLHLAIYDSALERAENDADIMQLFLLSWMLIDRLGVNAVRVGLPMVLDLQKLVLNNLADSTSTEGKVRLASFIHGYLWAICHKFDLENEPMGHEINAEISRRKRFECWASIIRFPPLTVAQLTSQPSHSKTIISSEHVGTMRPFLAASTMVDELAESYEKSLISPPSSPPTSPGRVFSVPTLGFGYGYSLTPAARPTPEQGAITQKVKDEMCGSWSREACMSTAEQESNPSIAGSRTAGSAVGRQHLSAASPYGYGSGRETPEIGNEGTSPIEAPRIGGLGSIARYRAASATSSMRDLETSSRNSTMRVADLKRALQGVNGDFRGVSPLRRPTTISRRSTRSSASESMLSWNPSDDEGDAVPGDRSRTRPGTAKSTTRDGRPASALTSHPPERALLSKSLNGSMVYDQVTTGFDDDVPPVPPLPANLNITRNSVAREPSPGRQNPTIEAIRKSTSINTGLGSLRSARPRSRPASKAGAASVWSASQSPKTGKLDVTALLASIQPDKERIEHARVIRPPY